MTLSPLVSRRLPSGLPFLGYIDNVTTYCLALAGTAVGIAAAFSAPIGGLLFAMEELATSSFSQALGWQVFFACMLAVLTVDTFRSAQHALADGQFGVFDGAAGTVLFEVRSACLAETPLVWQAHSPLHAIQNWECRCKRS